MKKLVVFLAVILSLCGNAFAYFAYIPHLATADDTDWNDYLKVDNNGSSSASFTIDLYANGDVVFSRTYSVAALASVKTDVKDLEPTAECGRITYDSENLFFRLCFETKGGGIAEFELPGTLNESIVFHFGETESFGEPIFFKGIAVANMSSETVSIELKAIGKEKTLDRRCTTIDPYDRLFGAHYIWFPGVSTDEITRIIITSDQGVLCGITKSITRDSTGILFTRAVSMGIEDPYECPEFRSIESKVLGSFLGWKGDTRVELQNGQIWEQTGWRISETYLYAADVVIYWTDKGYKMLIGGTDRGVAVTRVK